MHRENGQNTTFGGLYRITQPAATVPTTTPTTAPPVAKTKTNEIEMFTFYSNRYFIFVEHIKRGQRVRFLIRMVKFLEMRPAKSNYPNVTESTVSIKHVAKFAQSQLINLSDVFVASGVKLFLFKRVAQEPTVFVYVTRIGKNFSKTSSGYAGVFG